MEGQPPRRVGIEDVGAARWYLRRQNRECVPPNTLGVVEDPMGRSRRRTDGILPPKPPSDCGLCGHVRGRERRFDFYQFARIRRFRLGETRLLQRIRKQSLSSSNFGV
jgi:hypothetical protein